MSISRMFLREGRPRAGPKQYYQSFRFAMNEKNLHSRGTCGGAGSVGMGVVVDDAVGFGLVAPSAVVYEGRV